MDFLIEPDEPGAKPGSLFPLAKDWAAIVAPGLHLAFQDWQPLTLEGRTIAGETASREIRVCGAGAYVVLKALAFHIRGENKDAYDLFYLLKHFGTGVEEVVSKLKPLLEDSATQQALSYLSEDFAGPDHTGPRRTAEFLYGRPDVETQADAVGFVALLLQLCETNV